MWIYREQRCIMNKTAIIEKPLSIKQTITAAANKKQDFTVKSLSLIDTWWSEYLCMYRTAARALYQAERS